MSNLIVRTVLENSEAFLHRFLILPIGREQEAEVVGEFEAAGLAGDEPAERCVFPLNHGFIRRIEMRAMGMASIHVSRRFVLTQKRPGLGPLHMFQAWLTEQELAQLVKHESRLGVATSLAGMIGRFYV